MLESILIEETDYTPKVIFDNEVGMMTLSGRSMPEDALDFYQPLIDWLDLYTTKPQESTVFKVDLDYFNSTTARILYHFIFKLEKLHHKKKQVALHWLCRKEDEYMQERGDEIRRITEIPSKIIFK